jgi:glucosyl-3-phosphoglycerate synthase
VVSVVSHIRSPEGPFPAPDDLSEDFIPRLRGGYHRALNRESHATDPWEWFARRTYHHSRFDDPASLLRAKEERARSVSVCLPTRSEAETVGDIVRTISRDLVEAIPLVDEVVVVDARSDDGTARLATEAGAVVYQELDILPDLEPLGGKGDALWKSLFVTKGDIIVFVDSDIREFNSSFVTALLGPLLLDEGIQYVKAFYERPLRDAEELLPSGGGRVTELVARPFLNLFFPELAAFIQPLAGEYAGTREVLEAVPFFSGYGVELGLLIDMVERCGLDGVAQVDVDRRIHRNQPMHELSRMSFEILQTAMRRLVSTGRIELRTELSHLLHQFRNLGEVYAPETSTIRVVERPPAASIPGYRPARA